MSGRGRNKAHRRKKWFCTGDVSDDELDTVPIPSEGPVEHTLAANDHPDGLGHSGDPEEEEVIVVEEPEGSGESGPPVVRVPRTPTQKEIEAHEATHIPHEDWCEFCMSGRARNKPHRKKSKGQRARQRDTKRTPRLLEPLVVRLTTPCCRFSRSSRRSRLGLALLPNSRRL